MINKIKEIPDTIIIRLSKLSRFIFDPNLKASTPKDGCSPLKILLSCIDARQAPATRLNIIVNNSVISILRLWYLKLNLGFVEVSYGYVKKAEPKLCLYIINNQIIQIINWRHELAGIG